MPLSRASDERSDRSLTPRSATRRRRPRTMRRVTAARPPRSRALRAELRFREVDQYVRDVRNWGLAKVAPRPAARGLQPLAVVLQSALSQALRIAGGRPYPVHQRHARQGRRPRRRRSICAGRPGADQEQERDRGDARPRPTTTAASASTGRWPSYCGRTARVRARVNRLVDEHTGKMIEIKSDCIMLEGVVCRADYHRFCTRAIYSVLARDLAREGRSAPRSPNGSARPTPPRRLPLTRVTDAARP